MLVCQLLAEPAQILSSQLCTFGLQFTFSCNLLVHDPGLRDRIINICPFPFTIFLLFSRLMLPNRGGNTIGPESNTNITDPAASEVRVALINNAADSEDSGDEAGAASRDVVTLV